MSSLTGPFGIHQFKKKVTTITAFDEVAKLTSGDKWQTFLPLLAFLLRCLFNLKLSGRAGYVVSWGVLFCLSSLCVVDVTWVRGRQTPKSKTEGLV